MRGKISCCVITAFVKARTNTYLRGTTSIIRRNYSSNMNRNTDQDLNQCQHKSTAKIDRLFSQIKTFDDLSLEDRLQLANAMIAKLPIISTGSWIYHDMAVLKVGHELSEESPSKKYNSYVKKYAGYTRLFTSAVISSAMRRIKENLEHQIAIKNKTSIKVQVPRLLKNVRNEVVAGRKIKIHGREEIFPFMHQFELWASDDDIEEADVGDIEDGEWNEPERKNDGVTVVLGGGNQSLITVIDALGCLFCPNPRPTLIKHHPLRPHLFHLCSELFAPFIDMGLLHQVIDDGLSNSVDIISNSKVNKVHVTGSLASTLKIEETIAKSRPHLRKDEIQKMISSELGCVTPWIIAPGHYKKSELKNLAKHIAIAKQFYAGCNCLNAQTVVIPSGWKQKDQFKQLLLKSMKETTTDPLYYPGSLEKVEHIVSQYDRDQVQQVVGSKIKRTYDGDAADFVYPYIVDCGCYGEDGYNDYALLNEAFGPLLAIVELPGNDEDKKDYLLNTVVPFVNNKDAMFGTLSCSLIYPRDLVDSSIIRETTGALNYGCVAHNTWSSYGYYAAVACGSIWGGSKFDRNAQSGRGFIGNYFCVKNVEKSVIYSRSLAFPIIIDKEFIPPAFLTNAGSAVYTANSVRSAIGAVIASFFRRG